MCMCAKHIWCEHGKWFPLRKAEWVSFTEDAVGSLFMGQIDPESAEMWLSPSRKH